MVSEHHAASTRSLDLDEEGIALKAIVEPWVALCECGCGKPVPMAKHTYSRSGQVKGQPVRFLPGHNGRTAPALDRILALATEELAPANLGPDALPCWLVPSNRKADGRRRVRVDGEDTFAYHVTYVEFIGPFPDGLVPDHLCRRPACVNPWHLDPVPGRVNIARGVGPTAENGRKEVCRNGHPLTEGNVRIEDGKRRCRICVREYSHEAYLRRKEARRAA